MGRTEPPERPVSRIDGCRSLSNDLEKPLGLDARKPVSRSHSPARFWGGAAIALVGLSGVWISLQGLPFSAPRVPEPPQPPVQTATSNSAQSAVEQTVQPGEPSDIAEDEAALAKTAADNVSPQLPGGAKIITVRPDDAATQGVVTITTPGELAQAPAIAHIPDPDLIEESSQGRLPKRAADGRRPMDVYARPWSGSRGAKVAIVVGGMGISQTTTERALKILPSDITLGFAPQGNSLSRWAQSARRKGHEILLQIPMEPFDYPRVDPGRGTLIVDAAPDANLKVLHESMGRLTNYAGVMNYLGARFSTVPEALAPVMADIGERGLLYLDDSTSARSLAGKFALQSRAGYAGADMVLDGVQDKNEILKSLDRLEATARAKGTAIGVATGFDVTIDAVAEWVGEAQKRGIEIVGVSALATDPEK